MSEVMIRSVDEFERLYFPKYYRKRELERIMNTPGEFGKYLADEVLKIAKRILK